jgi:hypothetical protein
MSATTHELDTAERALSIRFTRKGALVLETYAAARHWNLGQTVDENIDRIRRENLIGSKSVAWLHDVTVTLAVRFRADLAPLVVLAQSDMPVERWRDCLLWHLGSQGALWFAFLTEWLFPAFERGVRRIRTEDVVPFVVEQTQGRVAGGKGLTEDSQGRVAGDLLRMAADFGLLRGKAVREFAGYRPSDEGLLYVLHALAEREANAHRIIEAPVWRMYLLRPADVEHELLRLHQFQRLDYQVAGSLAQLRLPCPSLMTYAESLAYE